MVQLLDIAIIPSDSAIRRMRENPFVFKDSESAEIPLENVTAYSDLSIILLIVCALLLLLGICVIFAIRIRKQREIEIME